LAKRLSIIGISLFFILGLFSLSFSEDITITTYYPSPFGSYAELRAQRMAIGDAYIGPSYCWGGGCGNIIDANADLVVQGNVGIGTWNPHPQASLDVAGQTRIYTVDHGTLYPHATLAVNAKDNPEIWMEDVGNNTGGIGIHGGDGMILATEGNMLFKTGSTFVGGMASGTERMKITLDRVMIADSPNVSEELMIGEEKGEGVKGGAIRVGEGIPNDGFSKGGLTFREPFADTGIYSTGDGQISIYANNNPSIWIMNHGGAGSPAVVIERLYPLGLGWRNGVDIGVNQPAARLHILGAGAGNVLQVNNEFTDADPLFLVRNTGNVGIGTANPNYKLDVNGTVRVGLGPIPTPVSYVCRDANHQLTECPPGGPFPTIYNATCILNMASLWTCEAICDSNDIVLGGGPSQPAGASTTCSSYPSNSDRWLCRVGAIAGAGTGTCYARCADVAPPAH